MPPEGPDKGVDLLAAPGALGFGSPRICVQIKATDSPIDRVILNQLVGVMQNFHAGQGLLVSWSGFKQSIERSVPSNSFACGSGIARTFCQRWTCTITNCLRPSALRSRSSKFGR